MKKYHLTTIGNALLDMEFAIDDEFLAKHDIEKGIQTCIDHDLHLKMLEILSEEHCKQAAGGATTNSLVAAAQLGARTFYHCRIGNDEPANQVKASLESASIKTTQAEQMQTTGHTGKCLVLLTPDAERTMLTYLGVSADIPPSSIDLDAIHQSQYFLVEGFQCISDTSRPTNIAAMISAQQQGTKIALSFCDEAVVEYFKPQITEVINACPIDILFCNQHEAMKYTDTETLEAAIPFLKNFAKTFAITLGKEGAMVFDGNTLFKVEGINVNTTDTLGAGDLFAGTFLYALTHAYDYRQAAEFANMAAAELVTTFGPRLEQKVLKQVFENFSQKHGMSVA